MGRRTDKTFNYENPYQHAADLQATLNGGTLANEANPLAAYRKQFEANPLNVRRNRTGAAINAKIRAQVAQRFGWQK